MSVPIPCGRIRVNLAKSGFLQGQSDVAVAGASTAYLDVQYSLDNGASWSGDIGVAVPLSAVRHSVGPSVAIPSAARTNVLLRAVAGGGDGSSPEIFNFLVVATSAEPPAATPPVGLFDALFLSHIGTFADEAQTTEVDTAGATVQGWQNQVTGATVQGSQASSGSAPTVDTGELLNGYRTIRLTRSPHVWLDFVDLFNGMTEGTLFIVIKSDSDGAFANALWAMGPLATDTWYPEGDGVIRDGAGTTVRKVVGNPDPDLMDWHVYAIRTKAGEWAAYLDTAQLYQTNTNTVSFGTGDGAIGKNTDPGSGFAGYLAAFAMKTTWLDDDAILARITELRIFYGLA
jgi:hypothetical protein